MQFFKKFLFISFIFLLQLKSAYAEILLGNWILSNPIVNGKTSNWSAITKDSSFKSDVSISPSSIQVANHLSKNRLSELAINAVTQAIPDGTDFIIDSSSQQLKYNLKADNHNTSQYKYSSPFEYGDVYTLTQAQESLRRDLNEYPGQGNYFITGCVDFEYKYECYFGHKGEESDPKARSVYFSQTTNDTYDSNAKPQITSLVNVSNKVINLADQNNSSAVSYIAYVVKDLIQYDANYRQSLETQLDAKLQATSPNNHIVLKDGFYSVDGLKISEKYYNYLWSNGRKAPFLQAKEILASNPKITPDPRGAIGYLRYEANGLELIFNPETGQIGHIQPVKRN